MRLYVFACIALGCGNPKPKDDHAHHAHHHGSAEPKADKARGAYLAISCAPAAQAGFDRAFFFLHNMDYVSARKSFEETIAGHGTCAMLHWGHAMTYFQPLWPGQPTTESLKNGAAAVERAKANLASVRALERDFIAAVAAYYDGWDKADNATRLKSWEAGQRRVAETHPDDVEAQAFWALSRLATVDRKDKTYKEAVAVAAMLEKLRLAKPEHPGLLHYLLHAYDNPVHAQKAVGITTTYEDVSPDAAHALHMPSHIHVRLGNWKEVIDWNIKSAAAALKHPVAGRVSRDWLHAVDYMTYGYLQVADDAKVKDLVAKIDPATKYELNSGPGAYGLAASPARYALERRMWKEATELVPKKVEYTWDQYPWAEAVTHAARGLGAARLGDVATARAALAELERLKPRVESTWWQGRVQIEHDVISAWVLHVQGDPKRAEALFRAAAERELGSGKDSVEPGHVIAAAEELGEYLIETKRPADALVAFKAALAESPKRFNALFGAGHAAELAGNTEEAKRYYTELVTNSLTTSTRPRLVHARTFLAGKK